MPTPQLVFTEILTHLRQQLHGAYEIDETARNRISIFQEFQAIHCSSNRRVLIHVVDPQQDIPNADRLKNQLQALTAIDHPFLPEVFDIGLLVLPEKKVPFLIMRFSEQTVPLSEYIRQETPPTEDVVHIFHSLLSYNIFLHRLHYHGFDLDLSHYTVSATHEIRMRTLGVPLSANERQFVAWRKISGQTPAPPTEVVLALADDKSYENDDNYHLGLLLQQLLSFLHYLPASDHRYLTRVVQEMQDQCYADNPPRSVLITTMERLNQAQHLTLGIPELHPFPSKTLRLPEMLGVSLSPRLRALINHPWFQRLLKLRQLGLAYLVYPGAMHTRFEHSLGVYHNMTNYISALLADPENATFRLMMNEQDILTGLLASLLHDIGHFPFAHAMENVDHHRFNHVHRTYWFLDREHGEQIQAFLPCQKIIYEQIKDDWAVNPEDIVRILGKPDRTPMDAHKVRIFQSMISSPIDADKLDYLMRDSIHTGVQYGRSIDRDRFLQSLTINNSWDSIALNEKGRISAELLMICRYAMYSEVYWHHAIRALHAMITSAVRYYFSDMNLADDSGALTQLDRLFLSSSDDEVIEELAQAGGKTARLINCLKQREIYKRAAVIHSYDEDRDVFDHLIQVEKGGPQNVERFRYELRKHLSTYSLLSKMDDEDLLIDIPPGQSIKSVPLILKPSGREIHLGDQSSVWENIRMNFEKWVRKIRIFVHPDFYDPFQRIDRAALSRDIKDCAAQFFYRD